MTCHEGQDRQWDCGWLPPNFSVMGLSYTYTPLPTPDLKDSRSLGEAREGTDDGGKRQRHLPGSVSMGVTVRMTGTRTV